MRGERLRRVVAGLALVIAPVVIVAQPNVQDPGALPGGVWKETVLYGRKLFVETSSIVGPEVNKPEMRYAGNNLTCQSCHLGAGTQAFALSMIGVYAAFPAYMPRENEVRTIEDRVEGCMERSMNGRALPVDGREMKAMVAYLQFLSTGMPVGGAANGRGTPALALLDRAADAGKGRVVYSTMCLPCHQADGQGIRRGPKGDAAGYVYPPLWGPDSFNDGAGMHRLIVSASYIRANMPVGIRYSAPAISVEDAWDVAAFINSRPRPERAHLDLDYPDRSKKPVDAPFPPFADSFSLEQHRLGPFGPIVAAQKERQRSAGERGGG